MRARPTFTLLLGLLASARLAHAGEIAEIPAALTDAVAQALSFSDAKATIRSWKATGNAACTPAKASIDRSINGSGRYAAKVEGPGCTSPWVWLEVEVRSTAYVTTRAVRAGESLEGAVVPVEREVRAGHAPTPVTPGAKAARALPRGQLIEASLMQASGGVAAGTPVKVLVRAGALSVVQSGRVVPCSGGKVCAVMPSGKHVEGVLVGDQLVVEAP